MPQSTRVHVPVQDAGPYRIIGRIGFGGMGFVELQGPSKPARAMINGDFERAAAD